MPTDEFKRQIVWLYPKNGHSDIESEVLRKAGPFFGSMPTRENGRIYGDIALYPAHGS